MLRDIRLHEDRRNIWIYSHGEINPREFPGLRGQNLRLLREGDRVKIHDAEKTFVLALQRHPIAQRAEVIPKMNIAGRLRTAEDSLRHDDYLKILINAG